MHCKVLQHIKDGVMLQLIDTLIYLRILSMPSLAALQSVRCRSWLRSHKKCPTKAVPAGCCTIGGLFTSIECGAEVPYDIMMEPDRHCVSDGNDFIFYERNRCLTCTVQFSKILVNEKAVATSRIPTAVVTCPESGGYLNVWFLQNQSLLEVVAINEISATCAYIEESDRDNIELPLAVVAELVARFGNS
jgi:hypothetical protein